MTIREELEARERAALAGEAAKSGDSRGRVRPEPEDPVRPAFTAIVTGSFTPKPSDG